MDPKHSSTEIPHLSLLSESMVPHVRPESKKQKPFEYCLDFPDSSFEQILVKVKNHGLEHLMAYEPFFLIGNKNMLYFSQKTMSLADLLESIYLGKFEVDERYNQVFCYFLNMFHNRKIGAKELEEALKSLEEKYDPPREGYCRLIDRGHVAGTSLSQPLSLEGAGNSSTSGYPPGTNACGEGVPVGIGLVNNNGDPNSTVKHSPPGKGKVSHEEGAGGFADVSGDAIGSMNAPREGDLEMGLVNNNADAPAPGDVPSSVVHHVDHTAAGSGVYGENVAMTIFQVATAAYGTATSKFSQASHTTSLATSMAALLLADTNWKTATPIMAKAGIVVCGVGVLADIGKDLPLPLFMAATSAALLIIIVAILFAKRPA